MQNLKFKMQNFKRGFTFLEMLVVVSVILVAFMGIFTLLTKVIFVSRISIHKLNATLLAQEGIELVRNIRETNWLHTKTWNDGLGSGTYIVQYDSLSLEPFEERYLILNPRLVLYGYREEINPEEGIVESLFKRKITIIDNPDGDLLTDDIAVTSEVTWLERKRPQSILLEGRLYNWKSRE